MFHNLCLSNAHISYLRMSLSTGDNGLSPCKPLHKRKENAAEAAILEVRKPTRLSTCFQAR